MESTHSPILIRIEFDNKPSANDIKISNFTLTVFNFSFR